MKFPAILFLCAISTVLAGSVTIKSLVFPSESSTSFVEMIPQKPLNLTAFTLCMRVATELSGQRDVILFSYRSEADDELNVWHELDGSGEGVLFKVPQFEALETHLCVTWESSSGAVTLFMDGRKSLTKIYTKGHTIRLGGRFALGQYSDGSFGNFNAKHSFVGEICEVNLWDSVLSDSTIQDMVSGKRVMRGNIFDWETAELKINGDVVVVTREL